jgi:hypothetical protein
MLLCGATFNENSVLPWTRGDFRGVLGHGTNPPRRCAPPLRGDFQGGPCRRIGKLMAVRVSTDTRVAPVLHAPGSKGSMRQKSSLRNNSFLYVRMLRKVQSGLA